MNSAGDSLPSGARQEDRIRKGLEAGPLPKLRGTRYFQLKRCNMMQSF